MIDRLLEKDAKPEEYDTNMRQNDVYDGIMCIWLMIHFDHI